MNRMKSLWNLLNPVHWLNTAVGLFVWLVGPLLRFLGLMPPPQTGGFENISKADVEREAERATEEQEAIDDIMKQMSPAEVVKAYASASPEDRLVMDLSALDVAGQDWLLSLSDDDLTLLAMSTTAGCARSLEAKAMKPIYARAPVDEKEAEILTIPTPLDVEEEKRQFVAARVRELFHAPGVPNLNPQYVPSGTLH